MMQSFKRTVSGWIPSLLIMLAIFALSAQPASALPRFGSADFVIKKGGHMIGFGLLALAYWRGLRWNRQRIWLAWLLAVCYAATDEFHQGYVAGRHSTPLDVVLFDGTGAALALWLRWLWLSGRFHGNKDTGAAESAGVADHEIS
jgi:VanZ family protein